MNRVPRSVRPVTPLAFALALAAAAPAAAVMLDTSGYGSPSPPPPPVVTCSITENDITVTSFMGIIGYQLKGNCTVTFPGTNNKPQTSHYEGGGSWNSSNGMVNEFLNGRDAKNQLWEIKGGGTCKLDPWMTGIAAAGCSGQVSNATPNAPTNLVKQMKVPISAGALDAGARAILTGKTLKAIQAENQAPAIVMPSENQTVSGPNVTLTINPGPGSPTKNFALEWQAQVNGAWTAKVVQDQAPLSSQIPVAKFQGLGIWKVRAKAHQSAGAKWSDWRSFKVPVLGPPACGNTQPYGATYVVSATPSTMKAGSPPTTTTITVTNGSNQIWGAGTLYHLSYHWAQNGVVVVNDGERTTLPTAVFPCMTIALSAAVKAPPTPGTWEIRWDMVLEGVTWFSAKGVPTGNKPVTATP